MPIHLNPEDGADTFLWNIGNYLQAYKVSQPRRPTINV
jgi:hypothetical protein